MKNTSIAEAYGILGLEQGTSLEEVKAIYRQLALKTHPDKNPGNEDATAQFQHLSEAYNVLVKHLDRSSKLPPRSYSGHASYRGYAERYGAYDEDDEDDYYDSDDCYDDYHEYDDEDEDLDFYMFLFAELMRGRANRYSNMRYFREQKLSPETAEEYEARLRKTREEQEAAERRRVKEEADRKRDLEREREHEKAAAEKRQKEKKGKKKAKAEETLRSAAVAARALQERAQAARSAVFAAARVGDIAKVKKGIWEDNIDAAGGEIRKGNDDFVKAPPQDPKETLLHISASKGYADLVEWLDTHNADVEERTSSGLTAFHLAVQGGHTPIIKYFYNTYPPTDDDSSELYRPPSSVSALSLAVQYSEPEVAWLILNKGLASKHEIWHVWTWLNSQEGKAALAFRDGQAKVEEFSNLLMTFGDFTPPMSPRAPVSFVRNGPPHAEAAPSPSPSVSSYEGDSESVSADGAHQQVPTPKPSPALGERHDHPYQGRGRGRGRGNHYNPSQPRNAYTAFTPGEHRHDPDAYQHHQYHGDGARGRGIHSGYRGRSRAAPA